MLPPLERHTGRALFAAEFQNSLVLEALQATAPSSPTRLGVRIQLHARDLTKHVPIRRQFSKLLSFATCLLRYRTMPCSCWSGPTFVGHRSTIHPRDLTKALPRLAGSH